MRLGTINTVARGLGVVEDGGEGLGEALLKRGVARQLAGGSGLLEVIRDWRCRHAGIPHSTTRLPVTANAVHKVAEAIEPNRLSVAGQHGRDGLTREPDASIRILEIVSTASEFTAWHDFETLPATTADRANSAPGSSSEKIEVVEIVAEARVGFAAVVGQGRLGGHLHDGKRLQQVDVVIGNGMNWKMR